MLYSFIFYTPHILEKYVPIDLHLVNIFHRFSSCSGKNNGTANASGFVLGGSAALTANEARFSNGYAYKSNPG